jgi:deoxyribose-phosphate aldolase
MLCIRPKKLSLMEDTPQIAATVLALLDLTRLEDDPDDSTVRAMCKRAGGPFGHPAAVCVYSRFITAAREALDEAGLSERVAIATVANFPDGGSDARLALLEVEQGLEQGADEVDVVFPWRALLAGDEAVGRYRNRRDAESGVRRVGGFPGSNQRLQDFRFDAGHDV